MGRFEVGSFRLGLVLVFSSFVSLSMCRSCYYGNRYDQTIIGITTDDNVTHGSVLWRYIFDDGDGVVDDVWFPESDDRISSLVKVRLLTDPYYQIELLAVQPQINDLVDLEHITSVESFNESFGLHIQIGSELSQCAVILDLIDINSRPPEFMEPIPELNFEIDTNFGYDIFNDYMNGYLLIEDKDMSASRAYISDNNNIFTANVTAPPFTQAPYTWIYEVRLNLNWKFPVVPGIYYTQLVPIDDYLNEGRAVNVKLTIRDPLSPRFESLKYFYAPKTVPKKGDIFTVELKACLTHDRCRADVYNFYYEPNEIVKREDDVFKFMIDGDKYAGQEKIIRLMAIHKTFRTNTTTASLTISFPYLNIPFESVVVNPVAELTLSSNITLPKLGEGLSYKLVNSSLTVPIDTVLERIDSPDEDENIWSFIRELNVNEFGALQDHKTIVVELQAANSEDGGNIVGTSIVVIPVSLKEDETTTEGTSTEASSTVTENTTNEISSTLSDNETSTEVSTKPSCPCPADADNPDGCISTIVIATVVPIAVILICCSCTGVIYFYRRSRSRGIHYHMHDDISLFSASIYNNKTSLYDGKAEYDLSSQRTFDRSFSEDASVYKGHNQLKNVMDYPGYNLSLNTEDENLAIGYRPDTPPPPVSWIDINDDA